MAVGVGMLSVLSSEAYQLTTKRRTSPKDYPLGMFRDYLCRFLSIVVFSILIECHRRMYRTEIGRLVSESWLAGWLARNVDGQFWPAEYTIDGSFSQ